MRSLIAGIRATLKRSSADPLTTAALYKQNRAEPRGLTGLNIARLHRNVTPLTADRLMAIAERRGEPLAIHPAQLHAFNLLWVLRHDYAGQEVRAADVERIYIEICAENWWKPLRWKHKAGVAHHFRLLNGSDRTYRWFTDAKGARHRLSVYPISKPAPAPERAKRPRNMTHDVAPLPRTAKAA